MSVKGIDYEHEGVNIRIGEQSSQKHIRINPSKGVPVLITDKGDVITQSLAIISYLDDAYPSPRLIPEEQMLRTRVLEISNAIACDMHPVNNLRVLGYLKNELGVSDEQKNDWYHHWIHKGMTAVENLLSTHGRGPYCFGSDLTLADVCLVPQIANAQRFGCDLTKYPRAMDVYERCISLPSFEKAAPENQPDYIK